MQYFEHVRDVAAVMFDVKTNEKIYVVTEVLNIYYNINIKTRRGKKL